MPEILPGPYEIYDAADGESTTLVVLDWTEGMVEIHPGYGEAIKTVAALRLRLAAPWKPHFLPYLDITSNRLRANLKPFLAEIPAGGLALTIIKHGVAPRASFEIRVKP